MKTTFKALIHAGVDIDTKTTLGSNALHFALQDWVYLKFRIEKHIDVINALKTECGVRLNMKMCHGVINLTQAPSSQSCGLKFYLTQKHSRYMKRSLFEKLKNEKTCL